MLCYSIREWTDLERICSRINESMTTWLAGRFGLMGLCQLRTKLRNSRAIIDSLILLRICSGSSSLPHENVCSSNLWPWSQLRASSPAHEDVCHVCEAMSLYCYWCSSFRTPMLLPSCKSTYVHTYICTYTFFFSCMANSAAAGPCMQLYRAGCVGAGLTMWLQRVWYCILDWMDLCVCHHSPSCICPTPMWVEAVNALQYTIQHNRGCSVYLCPMWYY